MCELSELADKVYPSYPPSGRCSVILPDGSCCSRPAALGVSHDTVCFQHAAAFIDLIGKHVGIEGRALRVFRWMLEAAKTGEVRYTPHARRT